MTIKSTTKPQHQPKVTFQIFGQDYEMSPQEIGEELEGFHTKLNKHVLDSTKLALHTDFEGFTKEELTFLTKVVKQRRDHALTIIPRNHPSHKFRNQLLAKLEKLTVLVYKAL